MAKRQTLTTRDETSPIENWSIADHVVEAKGHKLRLGDIQPDALLYLVTYGYKQSMADAIAGTAKAVKDAAASRGTEPGDKAWAKMVDGLDESLVTVESITQAIVALELSERHAAIVAGTVGTREGGPRMTGIDKAMRDMATREVEAKAKALKIDLGTKEHKAGLVAQYQTKHQDRLRSECEAAAAKLAAIATAPVEGDDALAKLMA